MAADECEYDIVWSGGAGLTTYTPQRLGAVLAHQTEGCVTDWFEYAAYNRTHPPRHTTRSGHTRHARDGGKIDHNVLVYDVCDTPQTLTAWLRVTFYQRWWRMVNYSRAVPWPTCHLCNITLPEGPGRRYWGGRAHGGLVFYTPRHRSVCQSCYVQYRIARGTWPGSTSLSAYHARRRAAHTPATLAARRDTRRETRRALAKAALGGPESRRPGVATPRDPHGLESPLELSG